MKRLWKRRQPTTPLSTNVVIDAGKAIALRQACHRNDLEYVKHHLPQLTVGDINHQHQSESNSTALHEATRQGNREIVTLLLENGADRRLKNDYGETAFSLSPTSEVRELFKRRQSNERFIFTDHALTQSNYHSDKTSCNSCSLHDDKNFYEWELVDPGVAQTVISLRRELKPYKTDKELKRLLYIINKGYVSIRLNARSDGSRENDQQSPDFKETRECLKAALDQSDPTRIVLAYTQKQAFSTLLNNDMARNVLHDLRYGCSKLSCVCSYTTEDGTKAIASILLHCNKFRDYSEGTVYRGIRIKTDLLAHVTVGRCIITTTFVSTSENREVAGMFNGSGTAEQNPSQTPSQNGEDMESFFCTYIIKDHHKEQRTAIYVNELTQYGDEDEVLILPYAAFLITKRQPVQSESDNGTVTGPIEIELTECSDQQLIEYTRDSALVPSMQQNVI